MGKFPHALAVARQKRVLDLRMGYPKSSGRVTTQVLAQPFVSKFISDRALFQECKA